MIKTKPLCISLPNLADMLIMVRGWTLLILEVKGQCHNGQNMIFGNKLVNTIATKLLCASWSNLANINHGERMNPIDFEGQRSRSQWTCIEISL